MERKYFQIHIAIILDLFHKTIIVHMDFLKKKIILTDSGEPLYMGLTSRNEFSYCVDGSLFKRGLFTCACGHLLGKG